MKISVNSAEQTQLLGEKLASFLKPGDVILLDGDLGAGKTTFTKGIAKGLGIKQNIKSPTFAIIREYKGGRLPLYHMDVYRLENGGSEDLGLEDYFYGDGISVVEWSEFIVKDLPKENLLVRIKKSLQDDSKREIEFVARGERYSEIIVIAKKFFDS